MDDNQIIEYSTPASIGRQAGRGLRWSLAGILANKLGSFVVGLVLARLLTPRDFGVFALALAATAFVMHVNDLGIIAATVQWRGRLEDMASTAATLAVCSSVVVYSAVWLVTPRLAALAHSPASVPVIRVLTTVILIDGLTAVRAAALMRRFEQHRITVANLVGFGIQAPTTLVLASAGAGAMSFAVGQVAGAVVTGALVFAFARLPVRVGLDRAVCRRLLRFGAPLALSLGVEAILLNADFIIVGRVVGATELGFYLLAFNISSWVPGVIVTGVRYVSIAGLSRLAEQDGSLSEAVRKSAPILIAVILPIVALTMSLAPALVSFLYGDKWAPAAPVLRFLMVLVLARVLTSYAFDILTSLAATRAALWLNVGWTAVLIPALFVGTSVDGIRGAAVAHALVAMVVAIPLAVCALHRHGVQLAPIGPDLVRPLLGSGVAAGIALALAHLVGGSALRELVAAGGAGLVGYVLVAAPRERLARWAALVRRRGGSQTSSLPGGEA